MSYPVVNQDQTDQDRADQDKVNQDITVFLIVNSLIMLCFFVLGIVLDQFAIKTDYYCDTAGQNIGKLFFVIEGCGFVVSFLCTFIFICVKKLDAMMFIAITMDVIIVIAWFLGLCIWLARPKECDSFVNSHMTDPLNWWLSVMIHGICFCILLTGASISFMIFLLCRNTGSRRSRGSRYVY